MTKNDLKSGMLCQCEENIYLFINNVFITNDNRWDEVDIYKEDLTSEYPELNINKVSKVLIGANLKPEYWTEETLNNNLLWERKPKETITIGNVKYNKEEFEEAVKHLKPIK